jgi:hypothetical protein
MRLLPGTSFSKLYLFAKVKVTKEEEEAVRDVTALESTFFSLPVAIRTFCMPYFQGDQIWQKIAQWVIVCFGQLHENYRSCTHFRTLHSVVKFMSEFRKNELGYIWTNFSKNSSGHPAYF